MAGIARFAEGHSDWLFETHPLDQFGENHLEQRHCDGVLLVGPRTIPSWLVNWKGPAVGLALARIPLLSCVHVDQISIGLLAVRYFLRKGFRNLGHIGVEGDSCSQKQCHAFLKTAKASGAFGASLVLPDMGASVEQIDTMIINWIRQQPRPFGLLAANDEVAFQVCQACHSAHIQIPGDVAVLGVDIHRHAAALCRPELSNIELPAESVGFEGSRLLSKLMTGTAIPGQSLKLPPTRVRENASTDVYACADPVVAKVVAHIRALAHRPCRVDELARLAGVSRRVLEKRFKQALGQTVFEVVRHHQLSLARKLLEDSDLPLDEVVEHTAFASVSHLTAAMHKENGISPGAYRKSVQHQQDHPHTKQEAGAPSIPVEKASRLL